ncbi:hypothetical protein KJ895_01715 [Patescibacteria group bacterium]|nr:hypothetical protein [Patescibacteria group bacterium]
MRRLRIPVKGFNERWTAVGIVASDTGGMYPILRYSHAPKLGGVGAAMDIKGVKELIRQGNGLLPVARRGGLVTKRKADLGDVKKSEALVF